MTAIAGIWHLDGRPDAAARCESMLRSQDIYAPAPPAVWSGFDIALGRRLHQSLPEDRFDIRPQVDELLDRTLVADLRLDNRPELCAELGVSGEEAARTSDAGLLMLALRRWNEEAVGRLVGDFAFALWDGRARRLLIARDIGGQRPLHYHCQRGLFAFASMPKGLHALTDVPRRPSGSAITRFLALVPETSNESFFEDVERVRPGELCIVTSSGIRSQSYWTPPREPLRLRSEEYVEGVRERMDRAVSDRLRGASGPVGTHLSGGLDSATVAASAARLLTGRGRVTAFTAVPRRGYSGKVPRGRFADESLHAVSVAAMYRNMQHVLVETGGRSPLANLERNFFLYERPVLNLCNGVWSDAILDATKQRGLTVLLTGQMGNSSFSHSGLELLSDLFARGRWLRLARHSLQLHRDGLSWDSLAAHAVGPFLPPWLWTAANRVRGRRQDLSHSAVNRDALTGMHAAAKESGLDFSQRPRRDGFDLRLWVLGRVDFGNYTKGFLGGWGVDVRDPTADRRLLEFCLRIPAAEFLKNGQSRSIARRAFADRLPPMVLRETRSGLQAADWHEGLTAARGDLERELDRIVACPGADQVLHIPMLQRLIRDWPAGDWNSLQVQRRYRLALLRAVSGGHFLRKGSGSNA